MPHSMTRSVSTPRSLARCYSDTLTKQHTSSQTQASDADANNTNIISQSYTEDLSGIAVVAAACSLPGGADTPRRLWNDLLHGKKRVPLARSVSEDTCLVGSSSGGPKAGTATRQSVEDMVVAVAQQAWSNGGLSSTTTVRAAPPSCCHLLSAHLLCPAPYRPLCWTLAACLLAAIAPPL